jgi:flagellar hook-associated protein 1 FlgK
MGSGFFTVGVSGLNAAQASMLTAGHNIANASTPGFSRQQVIQTSNIPLFTGSGFMGQGTSIQTVRRLYSDFLAKQVLNADTQVAEMSTYATEINQIDNMLGDSTVGLAPALQGFFDASAQVANNPSSIPSRQAFLSAAESLASRFHSLDQQLSDIRAGVNTQIRTEIGTINSIVSQIADLNQRIIVAQAAGSSQPANDLYDQRDQLVSDLNKEVRVSVQTETDGSYSIFFGTGQPLVVGPQQYTLQAVPAPEDMSQLEVSLKAPNGTSQQIAESLISGGNLGGLLRFRSESLDSAQNSIGRIALAVANTVNYQHRLGQDLSGQPGGDFFEPIAPDVLGAPGNVGSAMVRANITVADYQVTYDGTNYTVTNLSSNAKTTHNALPLTVDGVQISLASGVLAGTASDPDVFLVSPGATPGSRVTRMSGNPDSAMLDSTGSNLQTLSTSDYRLTLSATNTFSLTRLSDGTTWSAVGATQQAALAAIMNQASPLGFDLALTSNTAYVGDSFLIRPCRTAARDLNVAITDARKVAAATPVVTGAAVTNTGTATMTAGAVTDLATPLAEPFTVRYEASSNSLVGFPVGTSLAVNGTVYKITDATTRIPFTSGSNISLEGVGFVISGAPADGDAFTVNAAGTAPAIPVNGGLATMFGMLTTGVNAGQGYAQGSVLGNPTVITQASNDRFTVAVDGGAAVTVAIPAGSYTPAQLAAQIQTAINAAPINDVTVTVIGINQIVVTSNTVGAPPSAVTLTAGTNTGTGAIAAGNVTMTASLPAANIPLTYKKADATLGLPDRLTGFPVGSLVTVTPPGGGTPTQYPISSSTDYVPYTTGATLAFKGVSFAVKGAPVDGDVFNVGPNPSGAGDGRNILAIGNLQSMKTLSDGGASFHTSYAQAVSDIGNKAREVQVMQAAQENLSKQSQDAMQSMSGVNLDEEAANLIRYQQAYQASAKLLEMAGTLFDSLLNL